MSIGTDSVPIAPLAKVQIIVLISDDGVTDLVRLSPQRREGRGFDIGVLDRGHRQLDAHHPAEDRSPESRGADHYLRSDATPVGEDRADSSILQLDAGHGSAAVEFGRAVRLRVSGEALAQRHRSNGAVAGDV